MTTITVYHLEMNSPDELNANTNAAGLSVVEAEIRQYQYNRFLYQLVGEDWQWYEKLQWSNDQWRDYAERDQLRTFTGFNQGSIAGYYELEQQPDNVVELKYFGLAPKAIGKGFGSYLLSHAIDTAWQWGQTRRVWLHTCTLDHPVALKNYQARGFKIFHEEIEEVILVN
jgi:GNAT superfamily N-acetyltransferase